jgi:hypothetical protein
VTWADQGRAASEIIHAFQKRLPEELIIRLGKLWNFNAPLLPNEGPPHQTLLTGVQTYSSRGHGFSSKISDFLRFWEGVL